MHFRWSFLTISAYIRTVISSSKRSKRAWAFICEKIPRVIYRDLASSFYIERNANDHETQFCIFSGSTYVYEFSFLKWFAGFREST